jgi:hypothetical protein
VRGGPITREQLVAKAGPLEKTFFALAQRSVNVADIDGEQSPKMRKISHQRALQ